MYKRSVYIMLTTKLQKWREREGVHASNMTSKDISPMTQFLAEFPLMVVPSYIPKAPFTGKQIFGNRVFMKH